MGSHVIVKNIQRAVSPAYKAVASQMHAILEAQGMSIVALWCTHKVVH